MTNECPHSYTAVTRLRDDSFCTCKSAWQRFSRWCGCCIAVGAYLCASCGPSSNALAAPAASEIEDTISPVIQPPELLQKIELTYPPEAEGTGQHGDVSVLVEIDASGRIVTTTFESGPELFRKASLETASQLKFAPATLDGVPVTATTRVSFHYASPSEDKAP